MTDVVALAAELLAIPSLSGSEKAVVDFVTKWLVARGWNVTVQEVSKGRGNVWASRSGGGVAFSTHLDTVLPHIAPRIEKDKLYGRGACDAKGIAAAMMVAAERLVQSGENRIDLLLVVGKSRALNGACAANNLSTKSRFLVNGEPTESKLASGAKGSLRVTVRTRGREAHSAYSQLGESAIEPLLQLLPTIHQLPLPSDSVLGQTTVNIGTIRGGTAANIVPAHAEAELMIRLVGDVKAVKARSGLGERTRRGGIRVAHSGAEISHRGRIRSRSDGIHVRYPAAAAMGNTTALRAGLHSRGAHAR